MSDIMLFGVLRMPMPDNPADMGVLEWAQVKDRMRQAADDIEKDRAAIEGHINYIDVLEAERDALRAELAAMERRARTFEAANMKILAECDALRAELAAERERAERLETDRREAVENAEAIAAERDEARAELATALDAAATENDDGR